MGALVVTLIAVSGIALAQGGDRQDAGYTLSDERPGRSTGERIRIDYENPDDPQGKPPAVRKVVAVAPKGARYDVQALASCTASDAELIADGGSACPQGSRLGGGGVVVDTGTPGPERFVEAAVHLFNNARDRNGELVYINRIRDNGARTVIRADVRGRRTITRVDPLPGTPPDGGAIDVARLDIFQAARTVNGERHRYLTTPSGCPDTGFWRTTFRFTYRDGVRQADRSQSPCRDA